MHKTSHCRSEQLLRTFSTFLLCLVLLWQTGFMPALAASVANYNLGSAAHNVRAPLTPGQTVQLTVGKHTDTVHNGQLLTPAEFLAVQQILNSGTQSLVLGTNGAAIGGQFTLPTATSASLGALIIPRHVTMVAGSPVTASSGILNRGDILSPSDLSLTVSGSLFNTGYISAGGTVNLFADRVINNGLIQALTGNINVQPATTPGLTIISKGTWSAPSGDISISAPATSTAAGITMRGGDYLAQQLNIDAGKGFVNGYVHNDTAVTNITACTSSFGAATPDLKLGVLNVSGDPTYFNTAGDVSLSSVSNTSGGDLALIASHDVIVTSGTIDTTVPETSGGGSGGSITIIAGANITGASGSGSNDTSTQLTISKSSPASSTGGAIDLSGVTSINSNGTLAWSSPGGNGGDVTLIAFKNTGAASGSLTPGTINLGTTGSITTAGAGAGGASQSGATNGNVLIIAGASSNPSAGSAITIPAIFSGWSATNTQAGISGGTISINTATPVLTANVTIKNGSVTAGGFTPGTLQPTSITMGSMGASNPVTVSSSISQWESDSATQALAIINTDITNEINGPGGCPGGCVHPTVNSYLTAAAQAFAEYLAQMQRFNHYTLNGAAPWDRGSALGISLNQAGTYSENFGYAYGTGVTPQSAFNLINNGMFSETNTSGDHHWNLTHSNYIGIGFASVGDTYYVVEDFAKNDPTPAGGSPNPSVPVHGGVAGGAGLITKSIAIGTIDNPSSPGTTLADTVQAVGASGIMPISINAGGANVTIASGNTINVSGLILTNGYGSSLTNSGSPPATGTPGTNGGNVTISATGNVTLGGIQSTGGLGGQISIAGVGGVGGSGGVVNVTSTTGDISILPPSPCSPCIAVDVSGGAGGQAVGNPNPGAVSGGAGGSGGSVTLSAPAGNITLTAISADGGGGSGGSGGPSAGAGGAGGSGGTISLTAAKNVVIQDFVSASGGGGGGAGGNATVGGGGGGGGSFASGGGGGAGNSMAGGGGGTLSEVSGLGGPSGPNLLGPTTSNGAITSGSGFAGGNEGSFGFGGGGGAGNANGAAGGAVGSAGGKVGSIAGGAGGAGGTISIQGATAVIQSTLGGFWSGNTVAHGGDSLLALGSGGSISVKTNDGSIVYDPNLDLTSTSQTVIANVGTSFTVGQTVGANGALGSVEAPSITLGNTNLTNLVTTGSFGAATKGAPTITIGGVQQTIANGQSVTPAEWIALIQVMTTGNQLLSINGSGAASSGSLSVTAANVPSSGFTNLDIPSGVTLTSTINPLSFSGSAVINGTLTINNGITITTFSSPTLTINGTINDTAGTLSIESSVITTGPNGVINAAHTSFGGSTINDPTGDVVLPKNLTLLGTNVTILAEGNIVATSKATSINLSSTTASGGSLTLLAGYDFTISPTGTINISGTSGGSIYLPKVAINTSGKANGTNGGRIIAVANANTINAGTILLGSINTQSSTASGNGGAVDLYAPGGISTGAINTHAAVAGNILLSAAAPTQGTITILGGTLSGNPFTPGTPGGGAAVITGSLNSSSTVGQGGSITVSGDGRVSVGGINTTGFGGGAVSVTSTSSFITAGTGGINTSGDSITSKASTLTAGTAGSITMDSASGMTVSGALLATGGSTVGSGGGGAGGIISLSTSEFPSTTVFIGDIKITGFVSAQGGNAGSLGGVAGKGGTITSTSGQLQVSGSSAGISVNAEGGKGGASGTISLTTYSVQPLPTTFDLSSSSPSVVALPGGLFTIGKASPVNGTAGNIAIASGSGTFSKGTIANGTGLIFSSTSVPGLAVQILSSFPAMLSGQSNPVPVASATGVRTMVTPSEALALYQITRNEAQNISLTSTNAAATGSSISIESAELPQAFTTFKLPPNMTVTITGLSPVVTLPATASIAGTINFQSGGTDFVDFGAGSPNIASSGDISATGSTLILSGLGGSWTNSGTISANTIALAHAATSTLTLSDKTLGNLQPINGVLIGQSVDEGMKFSFKAIQSSLANVEFGVLPVPVAYAALASAFAIDYTTPATVSVSFNLSNSSGSGITANIGGTLSAGSINITTTNGLVGKTPYQTGLDVLSGASLTSSSTTTISSASALQISNGVDITAGSLNINPAPSAPQSFKNTDIAKFGAITISSGASLSLGNNDQLISNGKDITATAKSGTLTMGDANTIQANGGNINLFASGNVTGNSTGGTQNNIVAQALHTGKVVTGGGIDVGSGMLSSTSLKAARTLASPGPASAANLGISNASLISNTGGVIVMHSATGNVNLNTSSIGAPPPQLLVLNGGAMVFETANLGSINFGVSQFQTVVSDTDFANDDLVVDTDTDAAGAELTASRPAGL
jgi:uncharacterized protein YkwD